MMPRNRVKYCDALRLIAIFSVVMIHVLAMYRDTYIATNKLYYGIVTFFDSLTRTGVPIFFMITGAFMLSKKEEFKYKDFIKKRVPKLCIPFLIISIIYYIYNGYINKETVSILNFIEVFTSGGGVKYHFWFMYTIITLYLFIPFLKVLVQNLKCNDLKILITIIFIFGNLLNTINLFTTKIGIPLFSGFILNNLIIYTNYVFLGYYLYKYEVKPEIRKKIYIIGVLSILALPIADVFYQGNTRMDVLVTATSIFPFFPSISIFLLFKYNYNKWKIPNIIEKFINRTTPLIFYIYMVHVLIMEIIGRIILKWWVPSRFIENGIFCLLQFIMTFSVSYIISMFINWMYNKIAIIIKQEKKRYENSHK